MSSGIAPEVVNLYRRAFEEFAWALWNRRMPDDPTVENALVVVVSCVSRATATLENRGRDRTGVPCRSLKFKAIFFAS